MIFHHTKFHIQVTVFWVVATCSAVIPHNYMVLHAICRTNSWIRILSEKLIVTQRIHKSPPFMEPDSSLLCLPKSHTCPTPCARSTSTLIFMDMKTSCLKKFCMPSSNGSSDIEITQKAKYRFCIATMELFYILYKNILIKVAHFLKICYHNKFQNPTLTGPNVTHLRTKSEV